MRSFARSAWQVSAFAISVSTTAQTALAQDSTGTPEPQPPAAAPADPQASALGDIIVTARRVEERLQDVPLSITAFNAQTLRDNKVTQIMDLGATVPNLNIVRTGNAGGGAITIRGVQGQGLPRIGLDSRVGTYLDGIYLARATGLSFDLADIERIEVLKGPQGTLFGRNVTAGSINLVTAAPTGEFGGIIEGSLGTIGRRRARATINFPEFGGFSVRLTYARSERDGDIKNLAGGFKPGPIRVTVPSSQTGGDPFVYDYTSRAAAETIGLSKSDSYFAAVRYEGIDGLVADYKYDRTDSLETNAVQNIQGYSPAIGQGCVAAAIALGGSVNQCGVGTIAFNGGVISAAPTSVVNRGGITGSFELTGPQAFSIGFTRPENTAEMFTAPAKIKSQGHNLTLNYQVSDNFSLRSITGYRRLETSNQQNQDGGTFSLLNSFLTFADPTRYPVSAYPAGGSTPFLVGGAVQIVRQSQFSQEIQAIGKAAPWLDYLVGGYYFREKASTNYFSVISNVATPSNVLAAVRGLGTGPGQSLPPYTFPPQRGIPPITPNGGLNEWGLGSLLAGDLGVVTSSSVALFGRVTIRPTDKIDIVIGGRYTRDHKTSRQPAFLVALLPDANPFTPAFDPVQAYLAQTFAKFTYDGTITYHVTPDINVYARYATAFLSGGQIRNAPFDPETTQAVEIGFKSELFDRRVRLNAAAFYQKSANFQFTNTTSIATSLGTVFATGLANLGSQKVKGFEVELTAVPVTGFTLSGSVGYNKQTYSQVSTGGTPLPAPVYTPSPAWTVQLAAQYDTPALFNDAYLSFRIDGNYRSRSSVTQPVPTTGFLPVELLRLYGLPTGNAAEVASSIAAYAKLYNDNSIVGNVWLANARISLSDLNIGRSKARISGFVKNIFDEDGAVYNAYFGYSSGANYVRAREFGVDLLIDF